MAEPLTPESELNPLQDALFQMLKRELEIKHLKGRDRLIPRVPSERLLEIIGDIEISAHDAIEIHHRAGIAALESEIKRDAALFEQGAQI